jgi:hypothetical protein
VTDRRSVLRTFFDVKNPRKVGCEPLCGHRSRATAVRTRRRRRRPRRRRRRKVNGTTSAPDRLLRDALHPLGVGVSSKADRSGGDARLVRARIEEGIPHRLILHKPAFIGPSGFVDSGDEPRRLLGTVAFGRADRCGALACRWRCLHRLDALPARGSKAYPASVTMRLVRDARDAPRARRSRCARWLETARDRGDEGDTGAKLHLERAASRRCARTEARRSDPQERGRLREGP